MSANILITGAAGYIGGSLVADFLASGNALPVVEKQHLFAAVRSEEQAAALAKLGINVLRLDLTDQEAVIENVVRHKISIVIHTASSINPQPALNLIAGLSKQGQVSGEKTYFIHTSGTSAFYERTGWPPAETQDTGPVFEVEKRLADSFPIRKTDVAVIESAKAQGVTSFIVVPSTTYGRGTGEWNKLSVVFPVNIKASIAQGSVNKFAEDTLIAGSHISDLTALYGRIVDKVLKKESIPSGTEGYYFALAHELHWWQFLDRLAVALHARGLVADAKTHVWPSNEAAAEALGVPVQFVITLWNSGTRMVSERTRSIGWEPVWNTDRLLQHIDDEVQDVIHLGQAKSSLIDSLFQAAKARKAT